MSYPPQPAGVCRVCAAPRSAHEQPIDGIVCRSIGAGLLRMPPDTRTPATMTAACRWCGQPATPTAPLVRAPIGDLHHDWPNAAADACPYGKLDPDATPSPDAGRAAAVPADGPGLTRPELMALWSLGDRMTRDLAGRLVNAGLLVVQEQLVAHGSPLKRYYRCR